MAYTFCEICNRNTLHLLANSCAEHSDWPQKINPRTVIDVVIPAYSPSEQVNHFKAEKKVEGKGTKGISFNAGSNVLDLMGIEPTPVRGKGEFCSYCGAGPLTENGVGGQVYTKGIANPRKLIGIKLVFDPKTGVPITFEDKILHLNEKVTACPKCCLNVQPIMRNLRNKSGDIIGEEMVSQGTKFPDFD